MKKERKRKANLGLLPSLVPSLNPIRLHPLETLSVSVVNLRHSDPVLRKLLLQLGRIQLAIAPPGLDDLALLLQREVGPLELRTDDVAEEREDLVVGDGTRVGEVEDADVLVLRHGDGGGEEVGEDGV